MAIYIVGQSYRFLCYCYYSTLTLCSVFFSRTHERGSFGNTPNLPNITPNRLLTTQNTLFHQKTPTFYHKPSLIPPKPPLITSSRIYSAWRQAIMRDDDDDEATHLPAKPAQYHPKPFIITNQPNTTHASLILPQITHLPPKPLLLFPKQTHTILTPYFLTSPRFHRKPAKRTTQNQPNATPNHPSTEHGHPNASQTTHLPNLIAQKYSFDLDLKNFMHE